jgi:hypothetical protein
MKFLGRNRPAGAAPSAAPKVDRRSLVVGAGVAGAAAIGASVLHGQVADVPAEAAAAGTAAQDGYQVTPHVLRYYETTRS